MQEKSGILVLAFLLIGCNLQRAEHIWHGFHFPNMLPYRFRSIFSFVYGLGYRAFLAWKKSSGLDILAMLVMVFAVSYNVQENQAYWCNGHLLLGHAVILLLFFGRFSEKLLSLHRSLHLKCSRM